MIQYNQLSAEDTLYIDMQVEDQEYYDNIYITGVQVHTADTYGTNYAPLKQVTQEPSKSLSVDLNIPIKGELIFIVPLIQGEVSWDCPCGKDECNEAYIYCDTSIKEKGLAYLKELGNDCSIPKGFIDFILSQAALSLSLETCNFQEAIKYWNSINKRFIRTTSSNCGCHGFN